MEGENRSARNTRRAAPRRINEETICRCGEEWFLYVCERAIFCRYYGGGYTETWLVFEGKILFTSPLFVDYCSEGGSVGRESN